MPLYIRDDRVDELAAKFMRITGAKSKTEAVRNALLAQIAAERERMPLVEQLGEAQAKADQIGQVDQTFDMKKFTNDLWGD